MNVNKIFWVGAILVGRSGDGKQRIFKLSLILFFFKPTRCNVTYFFKPTHCNVTYFNTFFSIVVKCLQLFLSFCFYCLEKMMCCISQLVKSSKVIIMIVT